MQDENLTKRLQMTMVTASALGIFIVAVVVAVAGITPLYQYLKEEEKRNFLLALNTKTTAVEEYLRRVRDVAMQIASRTTARQKLKDYNEGRISLKDFVAYTTECMKDAMNPTQEVWGITRMDATGNPVLQVGLEIPEEYLTSGVISGREPVLDGPISLGTQSYLVVKAPILDRGINQVGTDVILFRLFNLQRIIEDYANLGKTGETILGIVTENRIDLVFPYRGDRLEVSRDVPANSPMGQAMLLASEKRTGILQPADFPENHQIIAYGPIRGSNWAIAIMMSLDELFAPVDRQIWATGTIIVGLICVGTLAMILLVRPLAGKTIIETDELKKEIKDKTASLRQELSERKRIETWLRDSERRYQVLLANVPDVIFVLDENGCFTYANIQIEKFLESPLQKILETSFQEHIVPEDRSHVGKILELGLEQVWDGEVGVIDTKGTVKYARIRCKASQEEETRLRRYEGVMRDITVRKQLEEELKTSRSELLEKIKIIDDLYEHILQSGMSRCITDHTAEVAHELRQPLAIIGGFARRMTRQIMSGMDVNTPDLNESCQIITIEIQRLEKILSGLIDFTTHEAIHLENFDPNVIIQKVLQFQASKIADKNLRVETTLGKEIGEVMLDPARIEQVIRNLISDAIEASPPDEAIVIETGVSIPSDKAQESGGLEAENYFELKVRNFGKVIPKEELQKIFSPFYTTDNYGTGIGLTISKRIVEDHQGSISVKSDEQGTVFTVWLPLHHKTTGSFRTVIHNNH